MAFVLMLWVHSSSTRMNGTIDSCVYTVSLLPFSLVVYSLQKIMVTFMEMFYMNCRHFLEHLCRFRWALVLRLRAISLSQCPLVMMNTVDVVAMARNYASTETLSVILFVTVCSMNLVVMSVRLSMGRRPV